MRKRNDEALIAWRDSQQRLQNATNGHADVDGDALQAEVEGDRNLFQQVSSEHMSERMDALREAEGRRRSATPSTPPFHQAAKDEMAIAKDIWHSARQSDEDTPEHSNGG